MPNGLSRWSPTIAASSVYGMPANTQGLATLQMLNIIENFDLRGIRFSVGAVDPGAD